MPPEPPADRALVLGIGNPLMTDDGVGLRLLEALVEFTPSLPGVEYVDAGTLSFLLLPRIECASALLVLDAARLGLHPGAVRSFTGAAMDDFLRGASAGVHDVGLRDLLDAARLTDALPDRRALVGVQPESIGWGTELSATVQGSVHTAVLAAREILERWMRRDEASVAT